jgi:hypothetical protein
LLLLPAYRYNSGARQFISDIDCRSNVLSEIADNRTNDEIGNNIFHSSRYSNVSCYLSQSSGIFNDIKLNIDDDVYQTVLEHSFVKNIMVFSLNNTNSCLDCQSTIPHHFAHLEIYIIALFK